MSLLAFLVAAWVAGSPLSAPRSEVAAAPLRSEIVVVGGFDASGGNSRRVDAYDTRRNTWRRLPNLPVPVDHAVAASARGSGVRRRRLRIRSPSAEDGVRVRR